MTNSLLTNFFLARANAALYQVPTLLSNISFYKRLHRRLQAGQDLSEEVPEIKAVGIDVAKEVTLEAIHDFENQIIDGWRIKEAWAENINTEIKRINEPTEMYPRFIVSYKISTQYGELAVNIKTMGLNIDLSIDTAACGTAKFAAINEAEQQLSFAVLQS